MDLNAKIELLGGLSPALFMRRHWQRKPLLVRSAWPGVQPPLTRTELFGLATRDDVQARLVTCFERRWALRHGPLPRRSLPPLDRRRWTLLVQGVDLHNQRAHEMLQRFRFVSDARLDDLMLSYASDGGGVGPHSDAYDVFLLQLQGRRRWRVGPLLDASLVAGAPLKRLRNFKPTQEWVLDPGDMLYLPPLWAHDGVAIGECVTGSIGFRAPARMHLVRELLHQVADALPELEPDQGLFRDPPGAATAAPGLVPAALQVFASKAWRLAVRGERPLQRALGELLTEPKAQVWFQGGAARRDPSKALRLDRRTRMMYDAHHVFINGEAFDASGGDAQCLRRLADERVLRASDLQQLSASARRCVDQWATAGWLHEC